MSAADHQKNPERVAAGLKAAIHNPNVSQEAKENAQERLETITTATERPQHTSAKQGIAEEQEAYDDTRAEQGLSNRALGGYKATLKNERVSDEAKEHAREVLDANDAEYEAD